MSKTVHFKNTSGQTFYCELGPKTNFESMPKAFDNNFDGHARLALIDVYGQFILDNNEEQKPFMYFRHTDISKNRYRFGNFIEFGDSCLEPQKGAYHAGEVATPDTPIHPFRRIEGNERIFGYDSDEPRVEFRVYDDHATMKEGDFFSVTAEPWPFTLYDHQSFYPNSSVVFQPSTWIGVFDGKPVVGLGSYDRFCIRQETSGFDAVPFGYISMSAMGIREDGRKECCFVSASLNGAGKTVAYYLLEGETPVITDHFSMEADWTHLPYVDDGTCTFTEATFRFCGKELHFTGKWGSKGFTEKPRIERHGQSHMFGTWYEGSEPYRHRLHCTIVENMDAYDHILKDAGFDIVDKA